MPRHDEFNPAWCEQEAPSRSWRSLFKYGDPRGFKHPNRGLYRLIKESFHLVDADFQKPVLKMGLFNKEIPVRLPAKHVSAITKIVGKQNLHTDTYLRTRASYGAGMLDALRLRNEIVENIPNLVLWPRNQADIEKIVDYCDKQHIPITIYGGGSTVTRGMEAVKGGICLDMSIHMKKVVAFNETNQTITVQAGMWGPELNASSITLQKPLKPASVTLWGTSRSPLNIPAWAAGW